jgi:Reverse transcriptase (RNA-dependent DNA polymerase)
MSELISAINSITSSAMCTVSFHILHVMNHAIIFLIPILLEVGHILCVFAKTFERLLNDQILGHVEDNALLSDLQTGFRRGDSTISVLLKVSDVWMQCGREDAVLVLLDFYKTFDCIPHELLVHKLSINYGFSPSAASMISSFLRDRSLVVEFDGVRSTPRQISSGVPQSSIWSPLLFSIFINTFLYLCETQIFTFMQTICRSICLADVAIWQGWPQANGLLLNPRKSQTMLIINRNSPKNCPCYCWVLSY